MTGSPRAGDVEIGERLQISGLYALSVLATGFCAWAFPSLRKADRFVQPDPQFLADSAGKDQPDVECSPLIGYHIVGL